MIKIPTIFKRDYSKTYSVTQTINPECQWVFDGKGIAYRKYQGMAAMINDRKYYKRYIVKRGQSVPSDFILCSHDKKADKLFGWTRINFTQREDKYYTEAYYYFLPDGTYELIGPKVLGNNEKFPYHILMPHKAQQIDSLIVSFDSLRTYLSKIGYEGIVWHHPDGRMAKIKAKDFGIQRGDNK